MDDTYHSLRGNMERCRRRDGKGPKVHIELRFSELRGLAAAIRKALA